MSSAPPASKGMMWSASVAGALRQMTQVCGPVANSSLRALLNSGVARRVMLFPIFLAPLAAPAVAFMLRERVVSVLPPTVRVTNSGCWMLLPADSHLDICDVWTLYTSLSGVVLYPRSRVFTSRVQLPTWP